MIETAYSDNTPAVTFAYDRGGREKTVTDAAGAHARSFTTTGELQTEQISGGILDGISLNMGYDSFLRRNSLQSSSGANTLSNQTYGYDSTSRLQTVTSGSQTATYAYYASSGLLNTTSFMSGMQIARSYDPLGRMQTIATTTPTSGTVASYTYTYNNLHQRTKVVREDGSYWLYGYNDRGELISGKKFWADDTTVWGAQTENSYDNLGNRTTAKSGGNQLNQLRQSSYSANSLNQYTQQTNPGAVDITGTANSQATVTVNDQSASRKGGYFYKELSVNNASGPVYQQVSIVGARQNFGAGGEDAVTQQGGHALVPQAVESTTYDFDGNVTSDGHWTYSWDAENRLTSMEAVASVPLNARQRLEFAYDATARRIQKKVYTWDSLTSTYGLESTTKFVYDGWNLVAEIDGSNVLVRSYVRGGAELLLINGSGNAYQVGYDGNENIGVLVDINTGAPSASYEYDPLGQTMRAVGEFANQNPFRFSNQYADGETGLIYYGYRYYSPRNGRWLSRDLVAEAGGPNLYGFLQNDSIDRLDLLGLAFETQIDNKDNPLTYSCNCGWIDWGHARPGGAQGLWKSVTGHGMRSLVRNGHLVKYSQEAGVTIAGVPFRKGVVGDYFVKDGLNTSEQESVALGIFEEVSIAFEESQNGFLQNGLMHSSFSEEDLVSNLIGFYVAVKGYPRSQIESWCGVIKNPQVNHKIWRNGGKPGTNRNWTPVYHEEASKQCGCCTTKPKWPSQFKAIQGAWKGDLYDDWKPRVDDFRRGINPNPSSPEDVEDPRNPRPFSFPL